VPHRRIDLRQGNRDLPIPRANSLARSAIFAWQTGPFSISTASTRLRRNAVPRKELLSWLAIRSPHGVSGCGTIERCGPRQIAKRHEGCCLT
jgi:hypothetical protein